MSKQTVRPPTASTGHQYDFVIFGKEPGVSNITIYYNTSDNTRQPVNVRLSVDKNLNATRLS